MKNQQSEYGIEAKPCPFCGNKYKGLHICDIYTGGAFECPRCGAKGPYPRRPSERDEKSFAFESIKAWNRREEKKKASDLVPGIYCDTLWDDLCLFDGDKWHVFTNGLGWLQYPKKWGVTETELLVEF